MRTSTHAATEQIQKQTQTQTQQTLADAGHPLAHMLITGHAGRGRTDSDSPHFRPLPPPPRSNPAICLHARKTDSLDKSISPEIRSR